MPFPRHNLRSSDGHLLPWTTARIQVRNHAKVDEASLRATERLIEASALLPAPLSLDDLRDEHGKPPIRLVRDHLVAQAQKRRHGVLLLQHARSPDGQWLLMANDRRKGRQWLWQAGDALSPDFLRAALLAFAEHLGKECLIFPQGDLLPLCRQLAGCKRTQPVAQRAAAKAVLALPAYQEREAMLPGAGAIAAPALSEEGLTHLDRLEAESIHILREVAAEAERPVMLYSLGKDSAVMLHLARKAFHPSAPPFPLLHIDTGWKFQAMYAFREWMARESGMQLLVHINPEGLAKNINPIDHGAQLHTNIMKTQGLKQALDHYGFDVAVGGARRGEEKSRAKERIVSFRDKHHRWDPKNQRPELWNLYNTRKHQGESLRVFPLSNWTELDIWQYLYREPIPIVPLYFAAERPVVERDGMLTLVDDDRLALLPGEQIQVRSVRFRTLGCYPLTGAIESDAQDLASVMLELLQVHSSERQGRSIDNDSSASMEKKKREGYF